MVKRRLSHNLENVTSRQEMRQTPQFLRRSASLDRKPTGSRNYLFKKQNICRRRTTSFESIDILQCVICKSRSNLSKMMKCRHNFCVHCFKNRFMISRKKDGKSVCPVCNVAIIDKKESKNTVSFAPLPPKIRDKRCCTCSEVCKSINKCKHCKNKFCEACWTNHVNDLKDELNNINGDLQILATKFEDKINNFRDKANEVIEFINRDIEAKINELYKKRENRIKKIERIVAAEETSVDDIRQRMQKVQIDVKEQDTSYATLSDNEEKIKTFLNLQQRAAEIMATVAIWESELNDIQTELRKVNDDKAFIRRNAGPLYKRRTFTPKVIVNRDIVHRPSALAIDSWRNNIITTCPGSGQVVILDRKFKLVRRIRHEEMIAPQGVTFLQMHDEIYVTDKWKHCIFVFNHKGDLVHRIGSKGNAESELCSPEGITFHPERSVLYIADTGNNRVQILEKDGTYLNTLGPKNKRTRGTVTFQSYKTDPIASQLNQPTDVAVTVTRVVVADSGNHKVKIFNHDGEILQSIGGIGTANGLFRSPEVLKIDEKGYIIVGDAENGRVQIFTPEGKFLRMLGAKKKQGHKFAWVSGLLVTNNYDILVSDSKANFIYLF